MRYLLILVLLSLNYYSYSQASPIIICGTFKADEKIKIKIYEPVNGYFNHAFYSNNKNNNYKVENSDSFYFRNNYPKVVSITVYITTVNDGFITKSILTLFPGDSVHLSVDLSVVNKESIKYTGSNAEGQKLFNDIDYEPIDKYIEIISLLNKIKYNKPLFFQNINNCIYSNTSQFDSLYSKGKISLQFKEFYEVIFKQLIFTFVIDKLLRKYKEREVFTKPERDSVISIFFNELPISNQYLKPSVNSFYYIQSYYHFKEYKKQGLSSIEPLFSEHTFFINHKTIKVRNECSAFLYSDDKICKEDLWAIYMLRVMRMAPIGTFSENIRQFKLLYPKSEWNLMLQKQEEEVGGTAKTKYVLQTSIQFIKYDSILMKLTDVLDRMPSEKAIFLDIWAPWCDPCIRAFRKNKVLDSFFLKNNIIRLYISLDYNVSSKMWKAAIQRYKLGGYHIMTNKPLLKDIKKIYEVSDDDGFLIPRYMLITKDKKIALKSAETPDNLEILIEQIKTFLLQ